ncbi:fibronectin type III domain-containing protein [Dickeya undicola]|uniref:fibronectin type III domain-containing protein n=1 Tax=Dickeya undicola TaxID=1577887 RepID=UPI003F20711F
MKTIRSRRPRRQLSTLLGGLLFGAYGFSGNAAAAVDAQRCAGAAAVADHAAFDKSDQDLSYPKINGLYQRPAATGVTLVGNNDGEANKYVEPIKGSKEGKYLLLHAGEHLTLTGQGYFLMHWELNYFNRGGTLLAENAPLVTTTQGVVKKVALTGRYAPDYPLDGEPGRSAVWNAGIQTSTGNPLVPFSVGPAAGNGEVMPSLWLNEIFYLDGTATFTQREGDVDYDISITPLTLTDVNNRLAATHHRANAKTLRDGVSLDPYIGEDKPPASPDSLTAGAISSSVVQLDWNDCSDNERGFIVEYSYAGHFGDGAYDTTPRAYEAGGAYTSAESLGPNATSVEVGTLSPNTTYAFRVKAYNQAGDSVYSNVVTVTTPAASALSDAWQRQDIGKADTPGSATNDQDVMALEAHNGDMWAAADSVNFVYQKLKGDGSITARLIDLRYSDPYAKAGVMIRNSLSDGSAYMLTGYTASSGAMSQWRSKDGAATGSKGVFVKSENGSQPAWLRLTRDGNTFISEVSDDGLTWTTLNKRINPNMNDTLYIGLALSSHNGNNGKVSFDNVSVAH